MSTGNWEPESFFKDRNVSLLLEGGQIASRLEAFFRQNWQSQYAAPFDRTREYAAPKISER